MSAIGCPTQNTTGDFQKSKIIQDPTYTSLKTLESSHQGGPPEPQNPTNNSSTNADLFQWAKHNLRVVGLSRIESFKKYRDLPEKNWFDWNRWCTIYPILKKIQASEAPIEIWVLNRDENKFMLRSDPSQPEEKEQIIEMKEGENDVYWYFWDYDTGMKKRMTGIAARQIECGYRWIKDREYEVDPCLLNGVFATEGIYKDLKPTVYKLSYQVCDAEQENKQHISCYQINASTGFQRLLERYPPETTPAKIRSGSQMEVYIVLNEETDRGIVVDVWVKGGRSHFQQAWNDTFIRFLMSSPVNRAAHVQELLDLRDEKKLVGYGPQGTVEFKKDMRNIREFVYALANVPKQDFEKRDASSCKVAIMNYMSDLIDEDPTSVSLEIALTSTRQHFGRFFQTVFQNETTFLENFRRQYNPTYVYSHNFVPYDLDLLREITDTLFNRDKTVGDDKSFSLSYIFSMVNGKASIKFAAINCISREETENKPTSTEGEANDETLAMTEKLSETATEIDSEFRELFQPFVDRCDGEDMSFKDTMEQYRRDRISRARVYSSSDVEDVLIEDAIFDTAISQTSGRDSELILTTFPFDPDHVYVFRCGSVARINKQNSLKCLTKIAHIIPGSQPNPRIVNEWEVLSVETYIDGTVVYGCKHVDSKDFSLTRKGYYQLQSRSIHSTGVDEKEFESTIESVVDDEQNGVDVMSGVDAVPQLSDVTETHQNLLDSLESLRMQIDDQAKAIRSYFPCLRRSDPEEHILHDILSHVVDRMNEAFPPMAVFTKLKEISEQPEVKILVRELSRGLDISKVFSALIRCYNNKSALGLVVQDDHTYLFEINVNTKSDHLGVCEQMNNIGLHPNAVLTKHKEKLVFSSPLRQSDPLEFSVGDRNLGELLIVQFGICGVLKDIFKNECFSTIESIVRTLHEWSESRKSIGRPSSFVVYLAQSESFDTLRRSLKKSVQGNDNPMYDEYLLPLSRFDVGVLNKFTERDPLESPRTVLAVIIDHGVFTFRKVNKQTDDLESLKHLVERAYGIDANNARNSFLYTDDNPVNIREIFAQNAFYVEHHRNEETPMQCPVCFETKDSLSTLSCGHNICHQCLRRQLLGNNNVCAMCRHDIMRPFMIPRANQVTKKLVHAMYGPMHKRDLEYCSLEDDVIWNKVMAMSNAVSNDMAAPAAVV